MFRRSLITITTDFGCDEPFVGVMKGVIFTINLQANIVDLTNNITPQNIQEAAFIIGMNYHYFPKKTIHLVVVDPGVGSSRRPLLVVADGHYFIGPDNGVFSFLYKLEPKDLQVIYITSDHLFLMKNSPTFQGRDVFSPCAAWLSTGLDIGKFGEAISDYHKIRIPTPIRRHNQLLQGEVVFIDGFGNAITNIKKADIDEMQGIKQGGAFRIIFRGGELHFSECYIQAEGRGLSALMNSSGYLEIFIFRGNAATKYDIAIGNIVDVDITL